MASVALEFVNMYWSSNQTPGGLWPLWLGGLVLIGMLVVTVLSAYMLGKSHGHINVEIKKDR